MSLVFLDITLKTIHDIKVIVFSEDDKKSEISKDFLALSGKEFISLKNRKDMNSVLTELQESEYLPKEVVVLQSFLGRFYQSCPCSQNVVGCNYLLINTCFGCLYNCTYCFLNSYLNSFGIMQFTNIDQKISQMMNKLEKSNSFVHRIGTGEFTDSLMFDEVTGIGQNIINKSTHLKNCMFEFKTKSNNISHLLNIKEKGNTVIAWSLNTQRNIDLYEADTANLEERIAAAQEAVDAGYFVAFHFDPIIYYDSCMEDYKELIDFLLSSVNPDRVVWISLGCFRYSPGFKEIIQENFPDEQLSTEEMFPSIDGKFRYFKNKRIEIYNDMISYIRSHSNKPYLYLCMETTDVWNKVFDMDQNNLRSVGKFFTSHLNDNFNIK